jgi:hypothetical protein
MSKNESDVDYFEDLNLLKAFAKQNEGIFLDFVEEYLNEMEIEARIDYERDHEED